MDKIKIQVMYNGNFFEFNEGLKAYLFHLGIRNCLLYTSDAADD